MRDTRAACGEGGGGGGGVPWASGGEGGQCSYRLKVGRKSVQCRKEERGTEPQKWTRVRGVGGGGAVSCSSFGEEGKVRVPETCTGSTAATAPIDE
jgi:hypothetical protein